MLSSRPIPYLIDGVQLYTDGGCRGNSGPGAIGVIIMDAGLRELFAYAECTGPATNNRAEYRALIKGLDLCATYTRGRVVCYSDSELLINQMTGAYRLKTKELRGRPAFKARLLRAIAPHEGHGDSEVYQLAPGK